MGKEYEMVLVGRRGMWNLLFSIVEVVGFIAALYFCRYDHLPATGWAACFLAVAAGCMSVHSDMNDLQKFGWLFLMGLLLSIELRATSKDRWDQTQKANAEWGSVQQNFERVLGQERIDSKGLFDYAQGQFQFVGQQQQSQLLGTIRRFEEAQQTEHREFATVLAKQQGLFDHEEKLAYSLSGDLVPGHELTPANNCTDIPNDGVLVFIGDVASANVNVIDKFPSVVLGQAKIGFPGKQGVGFGPSRPANYTPILSLDRAATGNPQVVLDMRSQDGKVMIRLNKDGFLVNRNNILAVSKTESKLVLIDQFGEEVLRVEYLNPHAIAVSGKGITYGKNISRFCSTNSGPAIISR